MPARVGRPATACCTSRRRRSTTTSRSPAARSSASASRRRRSRSGSAGASSSTAAARRSARPTGSCASSTSPRTPASAAGTATSSSTSTACASAATTSSSSRSARSPSGSSSTRRCVTFEDYDDLTAALAAEDAIKVATWWNTGTPVWTASVLRGIPVFFVQDIETSYYPDDERNRYAVLGGLSQRVSLHDDLGLERATACASSAWSRRSCRRGSTSTRSARSRTWSAATTCCSRSAARTR